MRYITASASLLLLASCTQVPHAAYSSRGGAESLMEISTEEVNVPLDGPSGLDQLVEWLSNDQPSRVVLHCDPSGPICAQAEQAVQQFAVPYEIVQSNNGGVSLLYERMLARDCDSRYVDIPHNPYNLPHPTFGCAMAVNSMMMISDKRQLTSPQMSGFQGADKMVQSMYSYQRPSEDNTRFNTLVGSGAGSN